METERKSKWGLWVMLVVNPFVILFVQNCSFFPTSPEATAHVAVKDSKAHNDLALVSASRGLASEAAAIPFQTEIKSADQSETSIHCVSFKKSCAE
jgi:hypothetical protein